MGHDFFRDESDLPLPHPPIPWPLLLKIEEAIGVAWGLLRDQPPAEFDLQTAEENEITHKLQTALFDRVLRDRLVTGFDRQVFTVGTRGAELQNFDGTRRDMKPDLLIGFLSRPGVRVPTQDWLFIECKPVGAKHDVTRHYCRKGITRFLKGEYAWAMTEALMVGYASGGFELSKTLREALKHGETEFHVETQLRECQRAERTLFSHAVYVSRHRRGFPYPETGAPAPCISLRHLWLNRDCSPDR
jgi:hypothetical protein